MKTGDMNGEILIQEELMPFMVMVMDYLVLQPKGQ